MNKKSVIPSPCISVCTIDENTGFCQGCRRSVDEIADWDIYSDKQKQQVLETLATRQRET